MFSWFLSDNRSQHADIIPPREVVPPLMFMLFSSSLSWGSLSSWSLSAPQMWEDSCSSDNELSTFLSFFALFYFISR